MGREVRRVPKNWEHPKREDGQYIALFDGDYERDASEWDRGCAEWNAGNFPDYASEESRRMSYEEWCGSRPYKGDYMPTWTDEEKTHLMMYETTTEGTPISPAFETPEELAKWLVDNKASAFGSQTGSYEGWLRVAGGGFGLCCSGNIDDCNVYGPCHEDDCAPYHFVKKGL